MTNRFASLILIALVLGTLALTVSAFNVAALIPYSGFAAGMLKTVLAVALYAVLDRYVLPLSLFEEIEKGNVAYGLMLIALGIIVAATMATAQALPSDGAASVEQDAAATGKTAVSTAALPLHVRVAAREIGTVEVGNNGGRRVTAYLRAVGLNAGNPWCAAFVRWVLDEAGADVLDGSGRSIRSAVATRHLAGSGSVTARDVLRGTVRPAAGSLVVWRNGSGWTGHIGFLERDDNWRVRGTSWYGRCGVTIEGNTSSGVRGSQRNGGGVYRRIRCIQPGARFRIVGFTPVDS